MKALYGRLSAVMFLLLFYSTVVGQATKKVKVYNAIVSTVFQSQNYRGLLLEVSDSSLTILSKGKPVSIPAKSIKTLRFKRKSAAGRGAMVGGITGFALGAIIGFASGDTECPQGSICVFQATAEENALAGGILFSGVGSLVGTMVGLISTKEKVTINGDPEIFRTNQEKMKAYLITTRSPKKLK